MATALPYDDDPDAYMQAQMSALSQYYDFSNYGIDVYITDDWIFFDGEKLPRSEFSLCTDGYWRIKDNIVIFDDRHNLVTWHNETLNFDPLVLDGECVYGKPTECSPSSFLTESLSQQIIAYDAQGLNNILKKPHNDNPWFEEFDDDEDEERAYRLWNRKHKPWVAGGGSYGIGESLTLDFGEDSMTYIAVLNGYVDPYHPDYYKKNSRVKKIKLTGDDGSEKVVELADEVRVQFIPLENELHQVTLTVLDVYKGYKYQDTCLSLAAGVSNSVDSVWSTLSRAKEKAESAYRDYEWTRDNNSEELPHDLSLIKQDWYLYEKYIANKISNECVTIWQHDIEIYSSNDLRIHLEADSNISLCFYSKEKIKAVSYMFKPFYMNLFNMATFLDVYGCVIEKSTEPVYYSKNEEEKDGWYVGSVNFGNVYGQYLALPVSAQIEVEYESGKKQKAVLSKLDLENVKRFGELMIGASNLK